MRIDWTALAQILDAVAWPVAVIIGIVVLRKPLAEFAASLVTRVKGVKFGKVSIELVAATEMQPQWAKFDTDVRRLTSSDAIDSHTETLFQQIASVQTADYAVIDLGDGDKWLTSRLYIFAAMLGEVSGMRALVFVGTKGDVRGAFIGFAAPDAVRRQLAVKYPWLDSAFERAFARVLENFQGNPAPSDLATMAQSSFWNLKSVVENYVQNVQRRSKPKPVDEWLPFTHNAKTIWEHTAWLDRVALQALLDAGLQDQHLIDSPDLPGDQRTAMILRRRGTFIAAVNEDRRFEHLIDRDALLQKLAPQIAETLSD